MPHSLLIGADHRLLEIFRFRRIADMVDQVPAGKEEQHLAAHEDQPAQRHADAGQSETGPPAHGLAEITAQDGRPEGTEIDAVIVEGEPAIAARIVLFVELAHDRGNVRLQEADTHHDERQGEIEDVDVVPVTFCHRQLIAALGQGGRDGRALRQALDHQIAILVGAEGIGFPPDGDLRDATVAAAFGDEFVLRVLVVQDLYGFRSLDAHRRMAGHEQQGAEGDGLAVAEIFVSEEAADQGQQIDQRGVGAVLAGGETVVEQEMLRQVEDEQPAHAVVGEALPHFREEQDVQPFRVVAHLIEDRDRRGKRHDDSEQDNDIDNHDLPVPAPRRV